MRKKDKGFTSIIDNENPPAPKCNECILGKEWLGNYETIRSYKDINKDPVASTCIYWNDPCLLRIRHDKMVSIYGDGNIYECMNKARRDLDRQEHCFGCKYIDRLKYENDVLSQTLSLSAKEISKLRKEADKLNAIDLKSGSTIVQFPAKMENQHDPVNHPSHYTGHPSGVECIDVTQHYGFCIGNAIKYLWRAGLKEDAGKDHIEKQIEDLQKSVWYINREIENIKKNK